jgi:hypothetical protein
MGTESKRIGVRRRKENGKRDKKKTTRIKVHADRTGWDIKTAVSE